MVFSTLFSAENRKKEILGTVGGPNPTIQEKMNIKQAGEFAQPEILQLSFIFPTHQTGPICPQVLQMKI
jgi:hypothetical protein